MPLDYRVYSFACPQKGKQSSQYCSLCVSLPMHTSRVRYIGPLREKQTGKEASKAFFLWGLCFERSRRPDAYHKSPKTVMDSLNLPTAHVGVLVGTFFPLKTAQYRFLADCCLSHSHVTKDKNVTPLIRLDPLLA